MIVVIDADYKKTEASVAGVFADVTNSQESSGFLRKTIQVAEDYVSGQFYKRELQCVSAILEQLNLGQVSLIMVDGYADFGTERMSLGQAVFKTYGIPVIGIAKKRCQFCALSDTEVYRGKSNSPLFVTSCGMANENAKEIVRGMSGENRLPYLVKLADSYARGNLK